MLERLSPYQTLALFFILLITCGGLLLNLPIATVSGQSTTFLDGFFTATSATTVTGLAVKTTATHFSIFGQLIIIFLIQIGGLGIMTISTLFLLLMRKKLRLKELLILQEETNTFSLNNIFQLTKLIALVTFIVEAIGGLLLTIYWSGEYGWKAIYYGFWHSISAFCNAGFDLFGNSMVGFSDDVFVNLVITSLIILGGLGFLPIYEIYKFRRWSKFSFHTKIVLSVSLLLIVAGTIIFFFSEFANQETMGSLPVYKKLIASYFQSVSARTAGFNSINISGMYGGALLLMVVLMFIGASPGSVGGGLKTTTAAVLFLTMKSMINGKNEVYVFNKRISQSAIKQSVMLLLLSMWVTVIAVFVLFYTDPADFMTILFEVVSSYATVGVSLDYTSTLSSLGKVCIMILMFVGRIGPITLAMALFKRSKKSLIKYPSANVVIG